MKKLILITVLLTLFASLVFADNYVPQSSNNFSVYIDPNPYLDGKMYATVELSNLNNTYRCISMIFVNETGSYIHIQSNPPPASSGGISLRVGAVTPEERGYFEAEKGLGTVYFRKFNQVAGAEFLYVVKCNADSEELTWESKEIPVYREIDKTLAGRATWVINTPNIGFVIFAFLLVLVLAFGIIKLVKR